MHSPTTPMCFIPFPLVPSNNCVQILARDWLPKNCIYQDKHKINTHPTQTRHTESLADLPTMLATTQSLVITELKWRGKKEKKMDRFHFWYCSSPNHAPITRASMLKCSGLGYPLVENRYRKLQPLSPASNSSRSGLRTLPALREQGLLQTDRKRPSFLYLIVGIRICTAVENISRTVLEALVTE